jgi:hypothetical protein
MAKWMFGICPPGVDALLTRTFEHGTDIEKDPKE